MLNRTTVPSIPSLIKLCDGFGITLAQFFSVGGENAKLTSEQKEYLTHWRKLDDRSKELALAYMQALVDRQNSM